MEKLMYLFSLATGELKRRKPKDEAWYWYIQNSIIDSLIACIVWVFWILTLFTRPWSYKRVTIATLDTLVDKPYSVDQVIKTLQVQYTPDMAVTVMRYPHWRVGTDAWTFRVESGVSNNKVTTITVIC
jgi:hypothetical protein